jgi:antitoxin component YwqK of YwqJK toxin-antitoxin module
MYKLISLLFVFTCLNFSKTYAQKFIEKFYNENMKEVVSSDQARFYSISNSTDSGWYTKTYLLTLNKLQMLGLFEDKQNTVKNGHFYWFYPDGEIKTICKYVHNQKEGVWLQYYSDGSLQDSFNYKNGNLNGISLSWYRNGYPKDSFNFNKNGSGISVSWFDNGRPSAAGRYTGFDEQNGLWKYYHKNGNPSAIELYENGVLKDKQYFNEDGNPADTSVHDEGAKFPGGDKGWSKYISHQLYFPPNYEFKNSFITSVVVTGTVNEDGQVIDAEVTVPLHPEFDKIALNALKKSPKWIPAESHNRHIYYYFTQTVTFLQSGY